MVVVNNAEAHVEFFLKNPKPSLKKTRQDPHITLLDGFHLTGDLQFRLNF